MRVKHCSSALRKRNHASAGAAPSCPFLNALNHHRPADITDRLAVRDSFRTRNFDLCTGNPNQKSTNCPRPTPVLPAEPARKISPHLLTLSFNLTVTYGELISARHANAMAVKLGERPSVRQHPAPDQSASGLPGAKTANN